MVGSLCIGSALSLTLQIWTLRFCLVNGAIWLGCFFSLRVMFDEPPCVTETGVENHSIYCCVGSSWTPRSVTKQRNLCETYVVSGAMWLTYLMYDFLSKKQWKKNFACERHNEFACEKCEFVSASEQCRLILWQLGWLRIKYLQLKPCHRATNKKECLDDGASCCCLKFTEESRLERSIQTYLGGVSKFS